MKSFVFKNRQKLIEIISCAKNESNELVKLDLLQKAASLARDCGIFSSRLIEDQLLIIAEKHQVELSKNYEINSFLHVFTQSYMVGGHTRVCERWIKNSPNNQKHSVIIINQANVAVPDLLREVVAAKNGQFLLQEQTTSPIEKALELRKIASDYEKIILHIHMDDIVPIIAFGTDNFKRPIIFFNHADHVFWLGVSIADLVVDLRSFAAKLDVKYRGTKNNITVPLPIDQPKILERDIEDINQTKKELGFGLEDKVILTMASSYKYKSFDNYDFIETIVQILNKNPNTVVLAIGPDSTEQNWQAGFKKSQGRIKAIGIIENDKIEKYLKIADLVIDSFPFSSFTALLDVAKYNIPCLSLKTPVDTMDSLIEGRVICFSQSELIKKASLFINKKIDNQFYKVLVKNHFPEAFKKNLLKIYQATPKEHKVNFFIGDNQNRPLLGMEDFVIKMHNSSFLIGGGSAILSNNKSFLGKLKRSCQKRIFELKNLLQTN